MELSLLLAGSYAMINFLSPVSLYNKGFLKGTTILDFGCGKYDNNKEFAEANGFEWYGYDPYNRTDEYNLRTTDRFDEE